MPYWEKASNHVKSKGKWLSGDEVIKNLEIDWENTYRLPFLCTTETNLRAFQFKFLHRRIATNDFLYKIGVKQVVKTLVLFVMTLRKPLSTYFGTASIISFFWRNTLQWISPNLTLTKEVSFSPGLCFGLINNISDLLLHHFPLVDRHYT